MPQPERSISDSISYLQNFLNASECASDEPTARSTLPTQPPASLPASFLHAGPRNPPPAPTIAAFPSASASVSRRSPPSTISVLSRHSSAPFTPILEPQLRPRAFLSAQLGKGASAFRANISAQGPLAEPASFVESATGRESTSQSFTGTAGMFRYGSEARRGSAADWRSPSVAAPRPLQWSGDDNASCAHRAWVHEAPFPRPSQAPYISPPARLSSSSSRAGAEGRFPWRDGAASVPAPTHHGASLLWGWGGEAGHDVAAASPSPFQPSPYASGDRYRGKGTVEAREQTTRRPAAYEEVEPAPPPPPPLHVAGHHPRRAAPAPAQRRPPLPPPSQPPPNAPPTPRVAAGVELTMCHNPEEHAANMWRIAHYLKDYYAREADEGGRGVASLTAEDVAGLAQCFYIDLYRSVRQARQAAGLETSSFVAEDPTENVIDRVAPPPPLQREERHNGRAQPVGPHAPPPPRREADVETASGTDDDNDARGYVSEGKDGGSRLSTNHRVGSGRSTPEGSFAGQRVRVSSPFEQSASPAHHAILTSSVDELQSSPAATTRLAPNGQLAYSGGGSHAVQVITARVPAFRNDDTVRNSRGQLSSFQHEHSVLGTSQSASEARSRRHPSPSFTYRPNSDRDSAADAASLSALATSPSPPYRHVTSMPPQQPFSGAQANWSHQTSSMSAPHAGPTHRGDVNRTSTPTGIFRPPSSRHRSRHRTRSSNNSSTGVAQTRPRPHFEDVSSHSSGGGHSVEEEGEALSYRNDDSESEEGTMSQRGRSDRRRPVPSEPSSGIVKRPLKDLMPQLRSRGTLIVKHLHQGRQPHLRLFQLLDCVDVFHGKEVLMPHFTWAASAEGGERQDRRLRPRKTKNGAPLPTGLSLTQQEVPYETALNLTNLEAVYVGAGRGISDEQMDLFHRRERDGVVLDHRHRPVANGMCAVFVFATRPVAVTFLREEDRQVWVGAMMGVVERNRTLVS